MNIDIKQTVKTTFNKVSKTAQDVGQGAIKWAAKQNDKFDTFVKEKGKDPKVVKQVGVGGVILAAATGLAIACIKGLSKNVDEEVKK
ncbi:MAG: hypothetical protein IJD57_06145 [Candidatus Gastranaerophilales bacterium]|nr:hypothetical protein [Candidatus Gastranaerophilales bacterium]